MNNLVRPSVVLDLDRPRRLVLDFNALAAYEDATGQNVLNGGITMSAKNLRALLWACLKADDPDLTLEQAGALIHAGNAAQVSRALAELQQASMPESEAAEARPLEQ